MGESAARNAVPTPPEGPRITFTTDEFGTIECSFGDGLELLGFRAGELVGRNIFEMYAARPDLVERYRATLDGERQVWTTEDSGLHFWADMAPRVSGGRVRGLAADVVVVSTGVVAPAVTALTYEVRGDVPGTGAAIGSTLVVDLANGHPELSAVVPVPREQWPQLLANLRHLAPLDGTPPATILPRVLASPPVQPESAGRRDHLRAV